MPYWGWITHPDTSHGWALAQLWVRGKQSKTTTSDLTPATSISENYWRIYSSNQHDYCEKLLSDNAEIHSMRLNVSNDIQSVTELLHIWGVSSNGGKGKYLQLKPRRYFFSLTLKSDEVIGVEAVPQTLSYPVGGAFISESRLVTSQHSPSATSQTSRRRVPLSGLWEEYFKLVLKSEYVYQGIVSQQLLCTCG